MTGWRCDNVGASGRCAACAPPVAAGGKVMQTVSTSIGGTEVLIQALDDNVEILGAPRAAGNAKCNSCTYLSQCRGGCRARTILAGQDSNLPDPTCLIDQPA